MHTARDEGDYTRNTLCNLLLFSIFECYCKVLRKII